MIHIIMLMVIVGIGATMAFMVTPLNIFIIGAFGVIIGVLPTILIFKAIAPRMYYYRFRLYEDREDGVYIEKDVSARKVKGKDQYEYLETPTGQRYRFPGLEFFHSGAGGMLYGDTFRAAGSGKESQLFPIKLDITNKKEIRKKIIPVGQRVWFSDNRVLGYIKEATKMPTDMKLQMIQMVSIMAIVVMVAVVMIFAPTWYEESLDLARSEASNRLQVWDQLLTKIDNSEPILCNYEVTNPEPITPPPILEPPPG